MKYILYTVVVIILSALLVFGESLIGVKLDFASSLDSMLGRNSSSLENRLHFLEAENESLRVQLLNESIAPPEIYKVYSSHPHNNVHEIAIAAGENKGIKEGDIVLYGNNVFVGRIKRVFKTYSIAGTIFDPNFELAVRIGDNEVDGLLKGGNQLTVDLISKMDEVETGDVILSASSGLPYGLGLGKVQSVISDPNTPFKKAVVSPAIIIKELRNVSIGR